MHRIRSGCLIVGSLVCIALGSQSSEAQYTANFQTNIISGVTSNWTGYYYVGNTNFADVLLIQNGGVLTGAGQLGGQISSSNNTAIISGPGSAWACTGGLTVGAYGAGNSLVVSNGGEVINGGGYVGAYASSSNNSIIVTGPNSILSNTAALYFGNTDGYDNLAIENGGHFVGTDFFIQGADDVALVTGPGSTMKNTGSITLWGGGMLVISNGGQVVNSEAWWWFGYDSVLVTGAGSVWSNRSDLWMGWDFGSNQSLIIANGGKVFNENGYTASGSIGSGNNSVLVTGTGSLWHNSITVNVGGLGPFCSLIISNGGQVVSSSGGYVDSTGGGSTVLVTDPGSIWSNGFSEMIIGEFGTGNGLVISNGGKVVSTGFLSCLGLNPSASNNSVVVAGLGSVWSNSSSLYVGYEGTSNLVQVAGGSVVATNIIVGVASAACNNLLKLDSGSLIVTNNGAGVLEVRYGQLILNGGVLQADTLVITNPCAQFVHTGGMLIVGKVVLDPNTFRLVSVARQSNDMLITWMMGPGATNTLQATAGDGSGGYSTNGFTDIFLVTNNTSVGTVTNYLDIGAATNTPARYYRARLAP